MCSYLGTIGTIGTSSFGANINERKFDGETALHAAHYCYSTC